MSVMSIEIGQLQGSVIHNENPADLITWRKIVSDSKYILVILR